jgi:hypothetical protein
METSAPVNMFFSTNEIKKTVLPKDDTSTAYIIFQNNELHTKLDELKKEMNEMAEEKNEMETEIGSLTRARTCLQGYVKNEYELAASWHSLATSYKYHISVYEKKWAISCMINIFAMLLFSMVDNSNFRMVLVSLYIPTAVAINTLEIRKLNLGWKNNETNKENLEKIEKINKSNLYIQDLVDNI